MLKCYKGHNENLVYSRVIFTILSMDYDPLKWEKKIEQIMWEFRPLKYIGRITLEFKKIGEILFKMRHACGGAAAATSFSSVTATGRT